jgi:glutaredoxin
MKLMKTLLLVLLVPTCFVVGLYAGPQIQYMRSQWFPEAKYVEGKFQTVFAGQTNLVVMYSTRTCPFCAKARGYFKNAGVAVTERLIDESPNAAKEFEAFGIKGVPLIFIGNRQISGFQEAVINESLRVFSKTDSLKN